MKTISLKKVSAVAVASLGFGLLSVVPAQAAPGQIIVTGAAVKGTAGANNTATGIVNNQVIFTYQENIGAGGGTLFVTSSGVGSIISASNSVASTVAPINGSNLNDGAKVTVGSGTETLTVGTSSASPGTQVVSIRTLDASSGLYTTIATLTTTWVAATATDLGTVSAYVLANTDTCNGSTAASTVGAQDRANSTALKLCVVLKNNSSGAYLRSTAVSVTSNGIGLVAGAAVAADGAVTAGFKEFAITGNGLPGTMELSIAASSLGSDGVTTVNKTASAKIINNGDFTAISLANLKKSIAYNAESLLTIDYAATDAKLNAAAIDLSGATWYVESDKGTTAVSSTAPNNSSATVVSTADDTITAATGASADTGRAKVTSGTAYEKLTIWVTKANAAGATITSNKVVVYVSTAITAVKTLNVTKAASPSGGGATTITVEALSDVATTTTAYPVVDGAAITFGATGGSLSSTSATTGVSGTATVTFYPSQVGGDAIVTITATDPTPDVVTTTTVPTSGTSILTSIAALNAKIVALNALIAKIMKRLNIR